MMDFSDNSSGMNPDLFKALTDYGNAMKAWQQPNQQMTQQQPQAQMSSVPQSMYQPQNLSQMPQINPGLSGQQQPQQQQSSGGGGFNPMSMLGGMFGGG